MRMAPPGDKRGRSTRGIAARERKRGDSMKSPWIFAAAASAPIPPRRS